MNLDYNIHSDPTNQYVEIQTGPVEISIKWPRILNNKIKEAINELGDEL